jgi:hypothetical protein
MKFDARNNGEDMMNGDADLDATEPDSEEEDAVA